MVFEGVCLGEVGAVVVFGLEFLEPAVEAQLVVEVGDCGVFLFGEGAVERGGEAGPWGEVLGHEGKSG